MKALISLGHEAVFLRERGPWYADNRNLWGMWSGAELVLYPYWLSISAKVFRETQSADVASRRPAAVLRTRGQRSSLGLALRHQDWAQTTAFGQDHLELLMSEIDRDLLKGPHRVHPEQQCGTVI